MTVFDRAALRQVEANNRIRKHVNEIMNQQESLADAKVSARQQCVYEDTKKSTANLQLMVNSNRGRITYGLRIAGYFRV